MTEERCGGHEALADELRAYATGALDLLEPWINQVRDTPPRDGQAHTCTGCPLCALLAVLRGERSEMAVRLAEQASGLLAVLRAALAEGNGPSADRNGPGGAGNGTGAPGHGPGVEGNGPSADRNGPGAGRDGSRAQGNGAGAGGSGADGGCRGVQRIPVSRADGGTAASSC